MADAGDDPGQRYLALWTQYLTALLADPRAMETLRRWASFTGQFAYPAARSKQTGSKEKAGGAPLPAWPPFFGPFGLGPMSPAAAPPANGVAELARRVDELERRLAKLEDRSTAREPRRKKRAGKQ